MAGQLPRKPPNPFLDDRRRPLESHQPQQDAQRELDRSRDRDAPVRRYSRDAHARRDSRDPRDPRDLRDDHARRQQPRTDSGQVDPPRRSQGAEASTSSTSPYVGKPGSTQVSEAVPRLCTTLPSRLVISAEPSTSSTKPPTIGNPEHQEIFNHLWQWSETSQERAAVKLQLSKWSSEAGLRQAYRTKLEKADEGTSSAMLLRTQTRQEEKEQQTLATKMLATEKKHKEVLEELVPKLLALSADRTAKVVTAPALQDDSYRSLEEKLEAMQKRLAEQEERLTAREQEVSEQQDRKDSEWQRQIESLKEQQNSAIKSIEAFRKENESLKEQLSQHLQEESKKLDAAFDSIKKDVDLVKRDFTYADISDHTRVNTSEIASTKLMVHTHSQDLQQVFSRLDLVETAQETSQNTELVFKEELSGLRTTCTDMLKTVDSLETEIPDTAAKVESLDVENLDKMINTWVDCQIPERVERYRMEIQHMQKELAAVQEHTKAKSTSTISQLSTPSSVTQSWVDEKIATVYKQFESIVTESMNYIGDMVDKITGDVETLKSEKLPSRMTALEQSGVDRTARSTSDSEASPRLKTLETEAQGLNTKVTTYQNAVTIRLQGLESTIRQMLTQPHDPTIQFMRQDMRPVQDTLEGVGMQVNHLDTQFKNLTTKDLARIILLELNNVIHAGGNPGKKALDETQRLSSQVQDMSTNLTRTLQRQQQMQAQLTQVSDLCDAVIRSGQRVGEKRASSAGINSSSSGAAAAAIDGHPHDPKRPRLGSNPAIQTARGSPVMTINGGLRQPSLAGRGSS